MNKEKFVSMFCKVCVTSEYKQDVDMKERKGIRPVSNVAL